MRAGWTRLAALFCAFAAWDFGPRLLHAQTSHEAHKTLPGSEAGGSGFILPLPIVKLSVEGNQHIPKELILKAADIQVGQNADQAALEKAVKRVEETGYFSRVGYDLEAVNGAKPGYAAKITVIETQPLFKVEFAGFPAKSDELAAYLKSRDPLYTGYAPSTPLLTERWASMLSEWMANQKQPVKIAGKLVLTVDNDYILQFAPDVPLPGVDRLDFIGNKAIDTVTLQNKVAADAYGLPYTEANLQEFLDRHLRPLYEAKGMMRVRFEDFHAEPVPPPVKGVSVKVTVVEGPVYKLSKVSFAGVDEDQLESYSDLAGFKTGIVANFDKINDAVDHVAKNERHTGFLHASVNVTRKYDDDAKKVSIAVHVDPGDKYQFGKLVIKGLDLNGEDAIRKQWVKKQGDPYNPDYADYFLTQVKDEGIFDHLGPTKSEVKIDEDKHVADVTLVFLPEEKKPQKDKRRMGPF